MADSFERHVEQVQSLLAASEDDRRARRRSVTRRAMNFVRPHGKALRVSDILADAIEREMRPGTVTG